MSIQDGIVGIKVGVRQGGRVESTTPYISEAFNEFFLITVRAMLDLPI